MTTVTWAQLTPGQQAYLDTLARAGGEGVITSDRTVFSLESWGVLAADNLIFYDGKREYVTPAGITVWQQGQTASAPPRSVWVALCGDDIISVHATSESSRLICEEVSGEKLEWETCDVYPDGTRRMVDSSYVYSVEEWRVLP